MAVTTAQRRMLLIGLVPLLLLVVGGGAVTVSAISGKLPFEYRTAASVGPNGVRVVSGIPTQVIGGDDDQVRVHIDGTYGAQRPRIDVRTAGGVLEIEASCPDRNCAVELTVEVPATKLQVQAEASVTMRRLRTPDVSVDGRRGSLTMQFDEPPRQLSARAGEGAISLRVPSGTSYAIDAVAAEGTTDIQAANDPAAPHRLYLRTRYGSIEVS
ncbi:hypothetical protein HPO96_19290 [Kribbella sandramycini]|uniref:Adhesin domain-containing protein n=1 Tax=Kribbella sandramycini TaxID=60450 RepID=A0A7Y4L153_9ACTN|nr:hypothetical protein [Kribbella sandramycini]MBB6564695.1 hypothetical protein [Kribbella sandramycini]NOL42397.1 hypothetical protein [Kribbella sandramycini]